MISAWRELYGLAGLNRQALVERSHLHHAIVHGHFVDLDFAGDVSRTADQPIRRGALVFDRQITAAGFRAANGKMRTPWRQHSLRMTDQVISEHGSG